MCPQGQFLLTNEYGNAECDCEPGKAYHGLTNACYEPYSQGPCPPGQIIKVMDNNGRGTAQCVPNPCPAQKMVMLDSKCQVQDVSLKEFGTLGGTCYTIGTKGPCTSGILAIDSILMEPLCLLETTVHSIFNLPNLRDCSEGGIRDGQGRCRMPFRFNPPRTCQRGSWRDSQGRCRRNYSHISEQERPIPTSRPGASGVICPKGEVFLAGVCYRLALSAYD
ncbi:hypothetical protein SK128_026932 [Halocaridina rubra]|uniref:DUF4789 domain-containing protein n=1 Tax=Halocaridina rubra TaxID=373956 RepID=A0AAN8XAL4_HALRR